MNFKEKKQAFNRLHDIDHLASDRELLSRYQPQAVALTCSGSPEKQENEVLWELLDFAGEDEIRSFRNRKVIPAPETPAPARAPIPDPVAVSKKKSFDKETEYSNIRWTNLENEDVQKALILYNDRINCFKEMRELDAQLDDKPTVAKVKRIVELRIRNILAFRELAEYNSKGKYLYRHPLIRQFTERMQLTKLLRTKPGEFLEEYGNCKNNITRYGSFLNRKNITPTQEKKWKDSLKKHEERLELFTEILTDEKNTSL